MKRSRFYISDAIPFTNFHVLHCVQSVAVQIIHCTRLYACHRWSFTFQHSYSTLRVIHNCFNVSAFHRLLPLFRNYKRYVTHLSVLFNILIICWCMLCYAMTYTVSHL